MTTLTDFLLARIAEDEAVAQATAAERHERAIEDGYLAVGHPNPARVLAECEAKRRIVEMWAARDDEHPVTTAHRTGLGLAIKALAQVYADHPDYQPEWSLDG